MLELTNRELELLTTENLDNHRFNVTYNDLTPPDKGETDYKPSDYMENDGRMYFVCRFNDILTGKEYEFQYIHQSNVSVQFPFDMLSCDSKIKIVDKSSLDANKMRTFKDKKERKELSPKKKEAMKLYRIYNKLTKVKFELFITEIPETKLREMIQFCKDGDKKGFNIVDSHLMMLPVCIQYKTEINSLWQYVRSKSK